MNKWKDVKLGGVSKIDRLAAEFDVWSIEKLPYAKFKVKIFEDISGKYTGYTDVRIKDPATGCPEGAVGWGETVAEALENTVKYFMNEIEKRGGVLTEDDIEYVEPSDF